MPQHTFVKEITEGDVLAVYQVRSIRILKTTRGDDYALVSLADRTGEITAKFWRFHPDDRESMQPGSFIHVHGEAAPWNNKMEITVKEFSRVAPESVDISLYRAVAPVDPAEIEQKTRAILLSIQDEWIRKLAEVYLGDEEFMRRFRAWPAARSNHHPYMHGLMEHVLSVLEIGDQLARHYSWVDRDLVLMGLFLHDSGKVIELKLDPAPDYTVEGELLGHITIGICELDKRASLVEGFPAHRLVQLKHIILSHHESPEYGSPKPPMFAEAQLIHTIEMLDARMNAFMRERAIAPETGDNTGDLRYSRLLKRRIYTPPQSSNE